MKFIKEYFRVEHWSPYEPAQRRRMLDIVLWVTLATSLVLSWMNLFNLNDPPAAAIIFSLAVLSVLGMRLNRQGHYIPASVIASGMAFLVVNFNLIEGYGLIDPAVVTFPILVVFGSLLFGKRATTLFAGAGILSVAVTTWLGLHGGLLRHPETRLDDAVTISVFIIISAVLVWAVMDALERNLGRLQRSEADLRDAIRDTLKRQLVYQQHQRARGQITAALTVAAEELEVWALRLLYREPSARASTCVCKAVKSDLIVPKAALRCWMVLWLLRIVVSGARSAVTIC
jgi:hypothetical protein